MSMEILGYSVLGVAIGIILTLICIKFFGIFRLKKKDKKIQELLENQKRDFVNQLKKLNETKNGYAELTKKHKENVAGFLLNFAKGNNFYKEAKQYNENSEKLLEELLRTMNILETMGIFGTTSAIDPARTEEFKKLLSELTIKYKNTLE